MGLGRSFTSSRNNGMSKYLWGRTESRLDCQEIRSDVLLSRIWLLYALKSLLTWIRIDDNSRSSKIAAGRNWILLVVVIECIRCMVTNSIGIEAASTLLNRRTVCTSISTGIVQSYLQRSLRRSLAGHAPALAWWRRRRGHHRRSGVWIGGRRHDRSRWRGEWIIDRSSSGWGGGRVDHWNCCYWSDNIHFRHRGYIRLHERWMKW